MDLEDKIKYLGIAMSLEHIGISEIVLEKIIRTYDMILEKGDQFTIKDACNIRSRVDTKYAEKKVKEEYDKENK